MESEAEDSGGVREPLLGAGVAKRSSSPRAMTARPLAGARSAPGGRRLLCPGTKLRHPSGLAARPRALRIGIPEVPLGGSSPSGRSALGGAWVGACAPRKTRGRPDSRGFATIRSIARTSELQSSASVTIRRSRPRGRSQGGGTGSRTIRVRRARRRIQLLIWSGMGVAACGSSPEHG